VKKLFIAIGVLFLFSAVTSIQSFAQDVINVCINNAGHARFVDDPSECKSNETPYSWKQVGTQGPPGPPGEKGDQGEQGPPSGPKVFDALGNFLGYLVTYTQWGDLVWNPEFQMFLHVNRYGGLISPEDFYSPDYLYSLDDICSEPFYVENEFRPSGRDFIAHPHLLIQHGPPPARLFVTGNQYVNRTHFSYSYKGVCYGSRDSKILIEISEVLPPNWPFPILPLQLPLRYE
jgi:hypothetical protein